MIDKSTPRLEGLFALSEKPGLDVRPTLLRVLTDLFIDARQRNTEDVQRYVELASHLIDQVDDETRIVVTAKLAPLDFAPQPVLDKLLATGPGPALRILDLSPHMAAETLWALATDASADVAAAVARRRELTPDLVLILARRALPEVAEALAHNAAAVLSAEVVTLLTPHIRSLPTCVAAVAGRRGIVDAWLAPLFLELEPSRRRAVIEAYVQLPGQPGPREATPKVPRLAFSSLEEAALARKKQAFADTLAGLLDIEAGMARNIVGSEDGAALAVALAAISTPADLAARMLMFLNTEAGTSLPVLRELTGIVERLPVGAAMQLLRQIAPSTHAPSAPRHDPVYVESKPARPRGTATQPKRRRLPAASRKKTER